MKVLYFDTFSLFYSHKYINSDKRISLTYEKWRHNPSTNLLKSVKPDITGIEKLRSAANESGFKMYPLGTKYTREMFIDYDLLTEEELAPDTILSIRMGDNDPIRRMIVHSHKLNATWYVCGDAFSEVLSTYEKERHLTSTFGLGVTDELISKVLSLKNCL